MQTVRFGNRVEQTPNPLWVTGYIQLLYWSLIDSKLIWNNAYREWSRLGPAYRHAHVHADKRAVAASAWQACVFS